MNLKLPRPLIVLFQRIVSNTVGILSRILHTCPFLGHPSETLSSRSHREFFLLDKWTKRRAVINRLFFWQADHCEEDWADQVARAHRTLEIDAAINAIRARGP